MSGAPSTILFCALDGWQCFIPKTGETGKQEWEKSPGVQSVCGDDVSRYLGGNLISLLTVL